MVKSKELKLMRKRLEKAEKVHDPLNTIDNHPFSSSSASSNKNKDDEPSFSLQYTSAPDALILQQCLDLFESNMGELYRNSSWGLDMDEKRSEFSNKKARYLLLHHQQQEQHRQQQLAAFVHFRFDYDDEEDPEAVVLYVYEIQVSQEFRRQGLGGKLMNVVERICRNVELPMVMLTVFKKNEQALQFYLEKLDYQIDARSPSQHGHVEDYEILSKSIQ